MLFQFLFYEISQTLHDGCKENEIDPQQIMKKHKRFFYFFHLLIKFFVSDIRKYLQ